MTFPNAVFKISVDKTSKLKQDDGFEVPYHLIHNRSHYARIVSWFDYFHVSFPKEQCLAYGKEVQGRECQ